jgi:hypothetical protein
LYWKGISRCSERKAGTTDACKSMGNNEPREGCFINKQEIRINRSEKTFFPEE